MIRYFSTLICFTLSLFASTQTNSLGPYGSVRYISENNRVVRIERLSPEDKVIYKHCYHYNEKNELVAEDPIGDLERVFYNLDNPLPLLENKPISPLAITPEYDDLGRVIQIGEQQFLYDDENHLIQVDSPNSVVQYIYDDSENRIAKNCNGVIEHYHFCGINEMAIINSDGMVVEQRIPGAVFHPNILRPIAIETQSTIYAPIHNQYGRLTKLVDIYTQETVPLDHIDPCGDGLDESAPMSWCFAGKHYDPETKLVYFGARFYHTEIKQWLTPDPLNQTKNPYEYCLGDPYNNYDPDGNWAFTIPLVKVAWGAGAVITSPSWAPYVAGAATGAAIGHIGYKIYKHFKEKTPPYDGRKLGDDASKNPGENFEWRGRGDPTSGNGAWHNESTDESLHPDFNHKGDVKPHWDYKGPNNEEARLFTDGAWKWK